MKSRLARVKDWEKEAKRANYNARELAAACGVSSRQLRRYLLYRFGLPSQEWLNEVRLRESHALLESGELVKEIAFRLGYKHSSRFCEAYKRAFGVTPTSVFDHWTGNAATSPRAVTNVREA